MTARIDFTDFIMSRYARKNSARGHLIGKLKEGILRREDPYDRVLKLSKREEGMQEEGDNAIGLLADWSVELGKIKDGTSKVTRYAGERPATSQQDQTIARNSTELKRIDWFVFYASLSDA